MIIIVWMSLILFQIVLGGANYSAILPPNSYIDVFNFSSPRLLAEYLQKVGTDKSLYNSYFEWKNNYCIERVDHNRNLCQLCKHLNNNNNLNKNKVQDKDKRKKWWINESNCRSIKFDNDAMQLVRA